MGETWTPFGFADFGNYEKNGADADGSVKIGDHARIDFSSYWSFSKVRDILVDTPSAWIIQKKREGVVFGT